MRLVMKHRNWKTVLGAQLGKSDRTIARWVETGPPTLNDAYALAQACGCKDAEASLLAQECFDDKAKTAS
jgi:hypothetical protein